jgi:hypothetical protein
MISNERRDYYAGGLMVVIGIGVAVMGSRYQIGTLTKMGPGFVQTVLGVLLVIIGAAIAFLNSRTQTHGEPTLGGEPLGIAGPSEAPQTYPVWQRETLQREKLPNMAVFLSPEQAGPKKKRRGIGKGEKILNVSRLHLNADELSAYSGGSAVDAIVRANPPHRRRSAGVARGSEYLSDWKAAQRP